MPLLTLLPPPQRPSRNFGLGNLDINSTSTGTLLGATADGIGSSVGTVSNFGGSITEATNILGTAGAFGSGAGTGDANAGGTTQFDLVNGMFTGLGTSQGGFFDQASGFFGALGAITFPGVP
jgi:hypothetical protein